MALLRGFVYVIGNQEHGWYKVGMARDVNSRLTTMRSGCPVALELVHSVQVPNARAVERALHAKLGTYRIHGEWFNLTPDILGTLPQEIAGLGAALKPQPESVAWKQETKHWRVDVAKPDKTPTFEEVKQAVSDLGLV